MEYKFSCQIIIKHWLDWSTLATRELVLFYDVNLLCSMKCLEKKIIIFCRFFYMCMMCVNAIQISKEK